MVDHSGAEGECELALHESDKMHQRCKCLCDLFQNLMRLLTKVAGMATSIHVISYKQV